MRKQLFGSAPAHSSEPPETWLNVEEIATVEMSSEDPRFPIELAFNGKEDDGWRAAEPGQQNLRLVFDKPQDLHRIRLHFSESTIERTQEFSLRWSAKGTDQLQDIVRQRWNFSPAGGSSVEIEDYKVNLPKVMILELSIQPDLDRNMAVASIQDWRLA
jgi:hypothetical protein